MPVSVFTAQHGGIVGTKTRESLLAIMTSIQVQCVTLFQETMVKKIIIEQSTLICICALLHEHTSCTDTAHTNKHTMNPIVILVINPHLQGSVYFCLNYKTTSWKS